MSQRFQKCVESFQCTTCGELVQGNGYTNHCPHCLWSRHVDVFPGDRKNSCRGMMEPISIEKKKGKDMVVHRCRICAHITRCTLDQNDNFDTVLFISKSAII